MITQASITIFSCLSIALFSTRRHFKWGFVAGLIGQPFWIYAAWTTDQWGILFVSMWFTVSHIRGIMNHFGWWEELKVKFYCWLIGW